MSTCAQPGDDQSLRAQVWRWLEQVPDPEIPVISVVDLGIVREVDIAEDAAGQAHCTIVITPTYSGCPAMRVIADEIVAVLGQHGVQQVEIRTQLAPAWSTDWMSEHGKSQLKGYGIAPPAQEVIDISGISRRGMRAAQVDCPHCGSHNTAVISQFGSTSCKSLYQCRDCKEPFDYFKAH